jgi:hypothetical protein
MKIINIILLGAMLCVAPLQISCQSEQQAVESVKPTQNTNEHVSTWWQRLGQKLFCMNLVMTYCSSEYHWRNSNPCCDNCMKCLADDADCSLLTKNH